MDELRISKHAILRFIERSAKLGFMSPGKPESTIRELLQGAVKENMNPVRYVKRLIDNGEEVEYLVADGLRFVVTMDGRLVLTAERIEPEQN